MIERLVKENDVSIIMPLGDYSKEFLEMGCTLYDIGINRRGKKPFEEIKLYFELKKIIKKLAPNKVITYSIKPNIYGGIICKSLRIPYYVNITGLGSAFEHRMTAYIVTKLYRCALRKVNKVFFENKNNLIQFTKKRIITNNKCCLLNGAGVNLDEYKFEPLKDDRIISFVFVGRIMKEKGVDELFEASKKLKQKYKDKVNINVVGFCEDAYESILNEYTRTGVINYVGFKKDVRLHIYNSHCLVLPSYHEGMANTILEASACGRAIIASRIPGCMESVLDGKTGYLIEPRNESDLYDKMDHFILLSFYEKSIMGINARKHMEVMFDKNQIVTKTVEEIMR